MTLTVLAELLCVNFTWLCVSLLAFILTAHLVSYSNDVHYIQRNGITGPLLARFSDAWLGWVAAHGNRSEVVHAQHKKYGNFVRLAPNHVSISDPEALHTIYGHGSGSGTLKSDFYDAFLAIRHTILTTRSREEHTRMRKAISPVFSQKSVFEFEPCIRPHIAELFVQWDRLCDGGKKGLSGSDGGGGWKGGRGRVWFNALPWMYYLTFDITGDLVFGSSFGMIRNGRDAVAVAVDPKVAMAEYGPASTDNQDSMKPGCAVREMSAVKLLSGRSAYAASMGVLPPSWRPIARIFPWYARGNRDVEGLAGLAIAAMTKRLASPAEGTDLLSKLLELRDEEGRPLSREQLTADALLLLIAGSDMVANPLCAIVYQIIANPRVQDKLQNELDDSLGTCESDDPATTFAQVKHLPYLDAVINEGLRVHPMVGLGLPRVVAEGGLTVCGKTFPEGTVLSVPTYTIHRDPKVWGEDSNAFRPERWLERDQTSMQKVFNAFSYGPRACAGRNLVTMELRIMISSIFHRYEFVLEEPDKLLQIHEGFIRRPVACQVGMIRRDA